MQRSLFLIVYLIVSSSNAQIRGSFFLDGTLDKIQNFADSLSLVDQVRKYKLAAISAGYYFVGLDSVVSDNDQVSIYLHQGRKMKFEIDGFGKRKANKFLMSRLKYLADHGYPFATIRIDSVRVSDDILSATIHEDQGPHILNDSSFFYSAIRTSPKYVHFLLDHVIGEPFSETSFRQIDDRIKRSSFLSLKRPADVSFQNEKAKLYLDIEETVSSSFEGILGLQQQGSGASTVVGGIDLKVQNLFRSGKELGIKWQNFASESQELMLSYKHPYFFGSKLTPNIEFALLKQDSIFLKRTARLDVGTYISPSVQVRLGYTGTVGSLLSTETTTLLDSDIADYNSDVYSIELARGRLDNLGNLNSDYSWRIGLSLGSKQIDQNLNLPISFYDTLSLKTDIFKVDFKSVVNQRIFRRQLISQQFEIAIIKNDELLNNERHRLGGLKSIRGFDEKVFFADQYALSRTELRSFFERESYIYLFYDQLLFREGDLTDTPFGTGLGFSLSTSSGRFNFALALGKSKTQRIDFANMKAHFGYITNF